MAESESILLQRFVKNSDAEAFSEIVKRYSGLVYGACLRVLGNKSKAADATQDTFFQLLRSAGSISGSLGGWLYKAATGKAIDQIRKDARRKKHESKYADIKQRQVEKWEDLSAYVDEALYELDEANRDIIIQHFFENKSMGAIAEEKKISQPTVSRRIDSAVAQLRSRLQHKGLIVAVVALGSLLWENAAQAAPAAVIKELAKMALVGTAGKTPAATTAAASTAETTAATAATTQATTTATAFGIKAKIITAVTIAAVGIGGAVTYNKLIRQDNVEKEIQTGSVEANRYAQQPPQSPQQNAKETVFIEQPDETLTKQAETEQQTIEGTAVRTGGYGGGYGGYGIGGTGTGEESKIEVDLSSPESTIQSFARILASGNYDRLAECFTPDSEDLGDLMNILETDDPKFAEVKQVFTSLGEPIEVTDIRSETGIDGVGITWMFTVTKPFLVEGRQLVEGDQFEMDATVVEVNGRWLIKGI